MITVHQVNNLSADNANGIVTPINDRRFYNMLVGGESGVVQGCEITAVGSTQIRVADGWGIVSGCLFTIEGETIDATLASDGEVSGRLLLQVDVSQSAGTFVTQAGASLPALQQDDLTASGSIYQLELATYTASSIAIENVEQTFATVGGSGFSSYVVQKNGTVFALSGVGNNVKFIAPAAFEDGNTFTVNGTAVTALTQDGEALSGGYFVSGAVVTAYLNGSILYFKSGGAALNFKVVGGTTQPANPSENTIWVNTATEITSWAFSVDAPTAPIEGVVWVKTSAASVASFNALKKNVVDVYPVFAQQYIGGAWENKTASIFQNGEWNGLEGDIHIIPNLVDFPATSWSSSNGGSFNAAGQLETGTTGSTDYYHRLLTPIDLTPYRTIKFTFTYENNNVAYIGVATTNNALQSAWVAKTGGTPTTYALDVSDLTGEYYIAMYGNAGSASTSRLWTVTAVEVLL